MIADGETKPPAWRLYSLIGLMTLLWSLNYVIAKVALREMPALLAFGLRTSLAGALIWPIYMTGRRNGWSRRDFGQLFFLGLVGVVFNQMFFILGLSRTTVAHASIIIGLTPILVLLIAWAAGQEKIGAGELTGMIIALTGVGVLQFSPEGARTASFTGDLLVFLAGLTFAIFTVHSKHVRSRYDGLTLNTFAYVSGALALMPFTIYNAVRFPLAGVSFAAWGSIVFMAVFPSVTCYLIYYYSLRYVPASRVAAFSYLQPLIATLIAIPTLNEKPTAALLAGGALVVAGVFVSERA